jgi:protease-4
VAGTHEAAQAISAAAKEKLTVAYASDLCCSAGYWLAASASRIYCNSTAICGSIGVYGIAIDSSGMADKLGLRVHVVKAGAHKGSGVPGTPVTVEQLAEHQKVVNALNEHFLAAVQTGRRMSRKQTEAVADGRVHVGQAAVAAGLVDQVLSFGDVWATLAAGRVPSAITKGPQMSADEEVEARTRELIAERHWDHARARVEVLRRDPELRQRLVAEANNR